MEILHCTKEELPTAVQKIAGRLDEPLYRGLGEMAERDYRKEGVLKPYEGSMSVGKGIFFSNNPKVAADYTRKTVIVTSREILDPARKAIDTRKKGYEDEARRRLNQLLGEGKYTDWQLWEEIQKEDTITSQGEAEEEIKAYVYTRRRQVIQEEIVAEIILEG